MNGRLFARARLGVLLAGVSCVSASCSDRAPIWGEAVPGDAPVVGLQNAVVVVDDPAHRALLVFPQADQEITTSSVTIGHAVQSVQVSPDQKRVFVLTAGDTPKKRETDQSPQLFAIAPALGGTLVQSYPLSTPLSGLALDPEGQWAVAYAAGGKGGAFVENPNELILFKLDEDDTGAAVTPITLPSFGGRPQRLTFTPTLALPGGARRLLVVETELDVSLLDLDHVTPQNHRDPITIRLTSGDTAASVSPAGIVINDGDPDLTDDARIAIRLGNDSNVVTITLGPVPPDKVGKISNDFSPTINLTDVQGIATDLAFVHTDGGLMLAALVPSTSRAVLIDPLTSITTDVSLPQPYQRMSLITTLVAGDAATNDTALLWNGNGAASGVAFWSLGKTAGEPYRSVEVLTIGARVSNVMNVAPPHAQLKVLEADGQGLFYVLDLVKRTASPLFTAGAAKLQLSPSGERLWAYEATNLASVDLQSLHPELIALDFGIDGIFDVARDGGDSLVALHRSGALSLTVLDARAPDRATSRYHSGLLLQGLQ